MKKLENRREINTYVALFTLVYFVSYLTRINLAAVIPEIIRANGFTKSGLSLAVTGLFVTYGAFQVVSGFFGDKIQPKKLILLGFVTTALMNLAIPFCRTSLQMSLVWCINGVAQAFMWPPLVRLMTYLFKKEDYDRACVIVSMGSSFGTVFVYLFSPLLISVAGWKSVFFISALAAVLMIVLWQIKCCNIEMVKNEKQTKKHFGNVIFTPVMLFLMLGIVLQGSLRDGVTTWMPSYISETYNLSSVISILTGVVLPIFGIICYQASSLLYRRKIKNPMTCAGIIFSAGFISALILYLSSGNSKVLSVIFCALLAGCMHGVNIILICMTPAYFGESGNVAFISGLLNACTYVGSALSTYGIARVAENFGWSFTILTWVFIAFVGSAVCLGASGMWKKRFG